MDDNQKSLMARIASLKLLKIEILTKNDPYLLGEELDYVIKSIDERIVYLESEFNKL